MNRRGMAKTQARTPRRRWLSAALALVVMSLGATACEDRRDMRTHARIKPLEPAAFFDDQSSARQPVPGTIARNSPVSDDAFHSGKADGKLVTAMPMELTPALIQRGQSRYLAYCAPCHGADGYGQGMIVRRGFPAAASFHIDRLRQAPDGHYFDVMTNGFGRMPSYGTHTDPADRWAIIAYIRALQLSQYARLDDVPQPQRQELEENRP